MSVKLSFSTFHCVRRSW